jgi:monovalent cation/hydrogen antiporter
VWKVLDFFLETIVFAVIGLLFLQVIPKGYSGWQLTGYAVVVFAVTVLARFVWVVPFSYFQKHRPPASHVVVVGWAGMRGVVSLAAAFILVGEYPQLNLVAFLTFTTVLGTLLIQGLTFPMLIRRLKISSAEEEYQDNLTEAAAKQEAIAAGTAALEAAIEREGLTDEISRDVVSQLQAKTERRAMAAWERLGGGTGQDGAETPSTLYRRLRLEMLESERQVLVRLRDARRIDDEVLRRVMAELDFEEAILER